MDSTEIQLAGSGIAANKPVEFRFASGISADRLPSTNFERVDVILMPLLSLAEHAFEREAKVLGSEIAFENVPVIWKVEH